MRVYCLVRDSLALILTLTVLVQAGAEPPADVPKILEEYVCQEKARDAVVARVREAFGKPFTAFTDTDYAKFIKDLDLTRAEDLWTWSHVTNIPVVALNRGYDFFGANAHLLVDTETAQKISAEELLRMNSRYREGKVAVTDSGGNALKTRDDAAEAMRTVEFTGQIRHNKDFAEDRTVYKLLSPYLIRLEDITYRADVEKGLRALPLSVVKLLCGKALYLTTRTGGRSEAIWHCMSSDLKANFAGMQPGVILEGDTDGKTAENLVRGFSRIVRETVLETQYFGIYAHPLQFPAFHTLQPERRRVFGRRRDKLPQTPHGYINKRAMHDAQGNFSEHLTAYALDKDTFRRKAEEQKTQGHPELMQKFQFVETLVESTSTMMEQLSGDHLAWFDAEEQREIMNEYKARQAASKAIRAEVEMEFGKPFSEFTRDDYAKFMNGLDLNNDDDLWNWSHVTHIPVVAINKRSNFFHMNAHLLANIKMANLMSWHDLHDLVTEYNKETGKITISSREKKVQYKVREMPADSVRHLETTEGLRHNKGWAQDHITYEAIEFCLVRLADLENREDINEAIRMLPLSVVQAHRGKAIYPTTRSRTGWAFTWRVSNEDNLSYIGLVPGGMVECRRDGARARVSSDELVENGYDSLAGNSTDSALHEVGHVIDLNVIGARSDNDAHPFQFPEMRNLVRERHKIFAMTARQETGYISSYSKVNSQENFAEHFWAYIRDPKDFLVRAKKEEAEGNDLLMQKYRFMEKLIDKTPTTMYRLSPEYLELKKEMLRKQMEKERGERTVRQKKVLAEYLARYAEKDATVGRVEKRFGKPFHEFTQEDYVEYMKGLDLNTDEDLWEWSHVTGIPVLALCRTSSFFSSNTHLLEDVEAAMRTTARESYTLKTEVDKDTKMPIVKDTSGKALPLRDLPKGVLVPTDRTHGFWHFKDFREARTFPEVLAPYLLPFGDLAYRDAIDQWIRFLPLSVVQIYRGKGIYFTTVSGRSYAPTMPSSNTTYKSNVGMQTGLWVEMRSGGVEGTAQNFIHEFGHIIDYVIIKGGYGSYRAPHQFPDFRATLPEKERIFGIRDDKVAQTPHGYVSRYAMTNAQESFAEHFRAYITEKDRFLKQAKEELAQGHAELMQKYRFMEKLIDKTPTTMRRLSTEFLVQDASWREICGQISRLRWAQQILGEDAPKAIEQLIDARQATAFGDKAAREEAIETALLQKVTEAVGAVGDKEKANQALAAILGMTLKIEVDRSATTEKPSLVATVRGADEGTVTGTLSFDTRVPNRFGLLRAPADLKLAADASKRVTWKPNTGDDLATFVAVATANLAWGDQCFVLKSEVTCRPSIPAWNIIGPFENPGGATSDIQHPPETKVDLSATYTGPRGEQIGWKQARRPAEAKLDAEFVLDFGNLLGQAENVAAYAVAWAHVPKATDALFAFGSADGAVVWVNGERQFAWLEGRRDYGPKTNSVPIRLKKGSNEILVKVTLTAKSWMFGAHLTNPEGRPIAGIRYTNRQPGVGVDP